jgi:hypothetical protein
MQSGKIEMLAAFFYLPRWCRSVVAIDLFAKSLLRRVFAGCTGLGRPDRSRFTPDNPPPSSIHFHMIISFFISFYLNFLTGDVSIGMESEMFYSDHVSSFSASMYLYFFFYVF